MWGSSFTAQISFDKAIRDAQRFDRELDKIENHLNRIHKLSLTIGFGSGNFPQNTASPNTTPFTPGVGSNPITRPASSFSSGGSNFSRMVDPNWRFYSPFGSSDRQQALDNLYGSVMRNIGYSTSREMQLYTGYDSRLGSTLSQPYSQSRTRPALPPPPPSAWEFTAPFDPASYNRSQFRTLPALPPPSQGVYDDDWDRVTRGVVNGFTPYAVRQSRMRSLRDSFASFGSLEQPTRNLFSYASPRNLINTASSIYIAGAIGNTVRGVSNATIGESMRLQEYTALLENSLISPEIGINRGQASALSSQLINAQYQSGFGISNAQLGLSRVRLAEQYKGLAPIVRLSARDPNEFQSGLQQGALVSSLLLARDPTQGQVGVNVALSELYSGGAQRFRSLAERFELPRSRLYEIEAALGGQGNADPGQVVMRVLEQMGFGMSYLEQRAGTLSGQMTRGGALTANFRSDVFERATGQLTERFTELFNSFEAFSNSPAYDKTLSFINNFFGSAANFVMSPVNQALGGNLLSSGVTDVSSFTSRVDAQMTYGKDGFQDSLGNIISAGEAFREAALIIQEADLKSLLNRPAYNPNAALRNNITTGALATLLLGMGANRLAGGALGGLLTGGGIAGLIASPALPALGIAAAAGVTFAGNRSATNTLNTLQSIRQTDPEGYANLPWLLRNYYGKAPEIATRVDLGLNSFLDPFFNGISGGYAGKLFFGERYATTASVVAKQGNETQILNQISADFMRTYDPSETDEQRQYRMGSYLTSALEAVGEGDPAYYLKNSVDQQKSLIGRAAALVNQDAGKTALTTSLIAGMKRGALGKGYAITDTETGQLRRFAADDLTDANIAKYAEEIAVGSNIPEQLSLAEQQLETLRQIEGNTAETSQNTNPYQGLSLSKLPGLFSGYDPGIDPRYANSTGVPIPGGVTSTVGGLSTSTGYTISKTGVPVANSVMSLSQAAGILTGSEGNIITTDYLEQYDPFNTGKLSTHYGLDIDDNKSKDVLFQGTGKVLYFGGKYGLPYDSPEAKKYGMEGKTGLGVSAVVLSDAFGGAENPQVRLAYGHLQDKDYTGTGEPFRMLTDASNPYDIGDIGTTGKSTGTHLHFDTRNIQTGEYMDPRSILAANTAYFDNQTRGGAAFEFNIGDVELVYNPAAMPQTPEEFAQSFSTGLMDKLVKDGTFQKAFEAMRSMGQRQGQRE